MAQSPGLRRVHRAEHAAADNHDPFHVLGTLPLL
jgi:hypothetical protein